ncbi:iron uptake porin [Lusitaniella coriacea LEGE 07157]|uniref:Iron uptake porin n=1 Tax=Lusitaniella coriacea LEGE 07157 TaxID=945747 RepID=A0A8J7E629_9CYAN|nr:iron uptake porin [Lusitaniella coriacea]MBE9118979.1 iron uptake porin [Lusitaniella coriacea LEGE 07157]
MFKLLWKCQLTGSAALVTALAVSSAAIAADTKAPKELALSETTEATVELTESEIAQDFGTATEIADNSQVLQEINNYSTEGNNSLGQGVEGAAKFRDVSPSDWAYQALNDLIIRYDCLVGYPDGTFRGNRALSRYEFAAGLNACLNQIERLIAAATADFVTREDLETLRRLLQEFEAELATLGTRVDNLEARTAFLEDHQFSTTTKLSGEVIFALTNDFGDDTTVGGAVGNVGEAAFGDRVRLEFNTSFTGRDRLVTRLAAGNLSAFRAGSLPFNSTTSSAADTGTWEGTQTFNLSPGDNNNVAIDWLAYYFPFAGINAIGVDNSYVYVAAFGGIWSDIAPTTNPYFEDYDGGNGALSTFASENPIYRIGGGAGAAISFGFTPLETVLGPSTITLGYLAGEAGSAGPGQGLLNGDYAALAQANFNLFDYFAVGLTYVHGYHGPSSPIFGAGVSNTVGSFNSLTGPGAGFGPGGVVGSFAANNPWQVASTGAALGGGFSGGTGATVTNSYGAEVAFRPVDWLSVSGFITKTEARLIERGDADIWTYGGGIAIPDLGKEGNVLGLFAGIQPTLKGIDINVPFDRSAARLDSGWHIEGFYKYQVTDNISITPGVIWLTRPNQNNNSEPSIIGTLRTTFTF